MADHVDTTTDAHPPGLAVGLDLDVELAGPADLPPLMHEHTSGHARQSVPGQVRAQRTRSRPRGRILEDALGRAEEPGRDPSLVDREQVELLAPGGLADLGGEAPVGPRPSQRLEVKKIRTV